MPEIHNSPDVIGELTDSGMDYFFLRPLKIADAGFITQQSANLGMSGTTRVLGSVVRNVIGRMDEAERSLQKAIQVRPQYYAGYQRLGILCQVTEPDADQV